MNNSFPRCVCGRTFIDQNHLDNHQYECGAYIFEVQIKDRPLTTSPKPKAVNRFWKLGDKKPTQSYCNNTSLFHKICKHNNLVQIGPHRIRAMSYSSQTIHEDVLIALSSVWLTTGDMLVGYRSRIGNTNMVYIHWPDYGSIPSNVYQKLLAHIIMLLKSGKSVAVGCLAGHGRTGSVLAGLIKKLENTSATEAIHRLRQRYCENVVETNEQIQLVEHA